MKGYTYSKRPNLDMPLHPNDCRAYTEHTRHALDLIRPTARCNRGQREPRNMHHHLSRKSRKCFPRGRVGNRMLGLGWGKKV